MAQFTAGALAEKFDTTPREVRKFLRATIDADSHPGRGGKWMIEGKQLNSLRPKFKAWSAAQAVDAPADAPEVIDPA